MTAAVAPVLNLSPNPATDQVQMEWEGLGKTATLTMINAQGQTVHQQTVTGNAHTLKTTHLPTGLYIITLQSEQSTIRHKLMIKQ